MWMEKGTVANRQAKSFLKVSSLRLIKNLHNQNRNALKMRTSLWTRHCKLNKHFNNFDLTPWTPDTLKATCRFYQEEAETAKHILCYCEELFDIEPSSRLWSLLQRQTLRKYSKYMAQITIDKTKWSQWLRPYTSSIHNSDSNPFTDLAFHNLFRNHIHTSIKTLLNFYRCVNMKLPHWMQNYFKQAKINPASKIYYWW